MYNANIVLVDGFLDSLRSLEMTMGTFTRNDNGNDMVTGSLLNELM